MVTKEQGALASVYGALGLTLALFARSDALPKAGASVLLSVLWLGFVLAISFMEAWVKFRAPFVPRHMNLDVGRTVFHALNAVEASLCVGLWLVHFLAKSELCVSGERALLIALTVMLMVQVAWLFPKLELRGKYVLRDELKGHAEDMLPHQREVFDALYHQVSEQPKPSVVFHIAYVVLEVVKVVLLTWFAVFFLGLLPK